MFNQQQRSGISVSINNNQIDLNMGPGSSELTYTVGPQGVSFGWGMVALFTVYGGGQVYNHSGLNVSQYLVEEILRRINIPHRQPDPQGHYNHHTPHQQREYGYHSRQTSGYGGYGPNTNGPTGYSGYNKSQEKRNNDQPQEENRLVKIVGMGEDYVIADIYNGSGTITQWRIPTLRGVRGKSLMELVYVPVLFRLSTINVVHGEADFIQLWGVAYEALTHEVTYVYPEYPDYLVTIGFPKPNVKISTRDGEVIIKSPIPIDEFALDIKAFVKNVVSSR